MADFRAVTATFYVSPQISLDDLDVAKAQGFSLVINNRPDGEAPGQPSSAEVESKAKSLGLAYVHIPVVGGPTTGQAHAVRTEVGAVEGKALAFCRSGTRSIIAWSLGKQLAGDLDRGRLIELAAGAGYDLTGVLPR
jgi:uncharacterized protein (TIGR01244 family)